jgi:hypothetical protein
MAYMEGAVVGLANGYEESFCEVDGVVNDGAVLTRPRRGGLSTVLLDLAGATVAAPGPRGEIEGR